MQYRKLRQSGRRSTDVQLAREILQGIQAAGVPTYRQTIRDIGAELRRCRRYEHPLVAVVVGLEPAADQTIDLANGRQVHDTALECMRFLLLGSLIRDVTRESDIVTYAAEEHVYALFLPEVDRAGAQLAVRRLARAFHARSEARIRVGIAEFPGKGLTVEALFDRALSALADATPLTLEDTETEVEEVRWRSAH